MRHYPLSAQGLKRGLGLGTLVAELMNSGRTDILRAEMKLRTCLKNQKRCKNRWWDKIKTVQILD